MTEIQTQALTQMIKNPTIKKSKKTSLDPTKNGGGTQAAIDGSVHANLSGTRTIHNITQPPTSAFASGAHHSNATTTSPPPPQPFLSAMDLYRAQLGRSNAPTTSTPSSSLGQMANHPFQSVSKTQLEKHAIRMRQMAKALEDQHSSGKRSPSTSAAFRRRMAASPFPMVAPQPPPPVPLYTAPTAADPNLRQNVFKRMIQSVLGGGGGNRNNTTTMMVDDDVDIVRELDHDLAQAVVYSGGKILGLPPDELAQSPGLRKLVARNIQWFQQTPDWLKLMGLCAAKKLNGYIGGATASTASNQTMLMMLQQPSAVMQQVPVPPVTGDDVLIDIGGKRKRTEEEDDDQGSPPSPIQKKKRPKAPKPSQPKKQPKKKKTEEKKTAGVVKTEKLVDDESTTTAMNGGKDFLILPPPSSPPSEASSSSSD